MPRHGLLLALALALGGAACGSAARPAAAPPTPAVRTTPKASAAAPPRPRLLAAGRHAVSLPVSSPWALPPMIVLHARATGMRLAPLRRRALHAPRLALSPSARRAVLAGRVSAGALALLLRTPRVGTPLLVFAASRDELRVQEITLWMTRRAVRTFLDLPRGERPARLLLEPVASDRADLAGPPRPRPGQLRTLVGLYRSAGYQYGIDWKVLAAINKVETNLGRNTHRSSAGAVGWMQFLPSTWRRWGVDASGDGVADPWNPQDAVYSAARYLAAAGGSRDIRRAIFAYNHANWYVNEVLQIAASLPESYGLGRAS